MTLAQIKYLNIPAADSLRLDDVMKIYAALRPSMPNGKKGACQEASRLIDILDEFDGLVLDAYGVINVGDGPIDGIMDLLETADKKAKPVIVLTNGSSFPSARTCDKYLNWQLPIKCSDVLSSRDAFIAQFFGEPKTALRVRPIIGCLGQNIEPLTGSNFLSYGHDTNFWEKAEELVFFGAVGWGEVDQIAFEAAMIGRPRPLHIANPDVTAPQVGGRLSAEPGYWTARMMKAAASRLVEQDIRWYGKPYAPAFELALQRMQKRLGHNVDNRRIAMVGDSLHTDILGGSAVGMTTVLITRHGLFCGGIASSYMETSGIYPDWVVDTL
ncbi:HAD hydrolase-like protein [Candidatus Puniceispirillum sp.]|nr:HAD hydrolase-like protein [Candidatus Puniceispirillum sp.]